MIWTKYNMIFESDKYGKLLYNSLTNSFLNIGEDVYNKIIKIKASPEDSQEIDPKLTNILLNIGALYNGTEQDVVNFLKYKSSINKYDKSYMNLTIIPTLDCNFKCIYCYEEGNLKNEVINNKTIDNIINFIKIKSRHTEFFNIHWFGGEPLLQFDKIVEITKSIRSLNVNFKASITTNGFLLTPAIVKQFKSLLIDDIQITIDGLKDIHNLRRPHKSHKDSFTVIINNLDFIIPYSNNEYKNLKINIRVNIDNDNKNEYKKIVDFFNKRYKVFNNYYIYPGIVKGETSISNQTSISCSFNKKEEIDFYLQQQEYNKNNNLRYYPKWYGIANCTATRVNDFVIGPKGELYNCWHDVGDDNSIIGNINNINNVIKDITTYNRFVEGIDIFDDKKCKNCFFLPICGGGCPYYRMLNKYHNKQIDLCTFHNDKRFIKLLEIHYDRKLKEMNKLEKFEV